MATGVIQKDERAVDTATLRADMQKVVDDFSVLMRSIGERGREKLIEGKEKFGTSLDNLRENARAKFGDAYERMSQRSKEAVEESRKTITHRPITILFTALAAGVIAGALISRAR